VARQSVRELSPIFLRIELPVKHGLDTTDHDAIVEDIMTTYNVNVQVKRVSLHAICGAAVMHD